MSTDEYLRLHAELCEDARRLSAAKNADYTGADHDDPDPLAIFRNFTACERLGVCSTEQGMITRLLDKLMRAVAITQDGHTRQVDDETLRDTVMDAVNYLILFYAYQQARTQQQKKGDDK